MSSSITKPGAKENPKLQRGLEQTAFTSVLSGRPLLTFTPDMSLHLTGEPVSELLAELYDKIGNNAKLSRTQALGCALYAMAQAALVTTTEAVCGFLHTRSGDGDSRPQRYKRGVVTRYSLIQLLKKLEEHEYVFCQVGIRAEGHEKGLASSWYPTERFTKWLTVNEVHLTTADMSNDQELLILKSADGKKKYIDYEDTEQTQRLRQAIHDTNEALQLYHWTYEPMEADGRTYMESGRIELSHRALRCRRIFHGDFESGGRFHCDAQGLRTAERETIWIDGEPTTEWDFKSLHPQMLYHMNELQPPLDCYDPQGRYDKERRALMKSVCQMMLNGKNRHGATLSLVDEVKKGSGITMPYEDAKQAVRDFESDHPLLQDHFYSGAWKRLQYLDSCIVEKVLLCCKAKEIPVLSIHDSFLTTTRFWGEMAQIVKEAYMVLLGAEPVIEMKDSECDWSEVEELLA